MSTSRRVLTSALAVVLCAGFAAAAQANPSTDTGRAHRATSSVPPPTPETTTLGDLAALAVVSSDDIWSIGSRQQAGSYVPFAEHWDGASWHSATPPVPPNTSRSYLLSGAAASADDVWAVGGSLDPSGNVQSTLVEHWDGTDWSVVPSPNIGGPIDVLNGVSVVSANDVWAVGAGGSGSLIKSLVEHWNGHSWKIVSSPNVQGRNANQLNHLAVLAPDDIWAVGYSAVLSEQYSSLAEHWNGHRWSIIRTPAIPNSPNTDLQDVSAVSPDDIWATGSYWLASVGHFKTLFEHWDGARWSRVEGADPSPSQDCFPLAVGATSTDDVWAAGWYAGPGGATDIAFIDHWDGTRWRVSKTPSLPGAPVSLFEGIAGLSGTNAWAVGNTQTGGLSSALIEHWNGSRWRVATA